MATAADKRRWDDLHAAYAPARAAVRDYESQLSLKYGGSSSHNWRSWVGRGERTKLEKLEARANKIGDKIVDLLVQVSPRGEAWLSGAPAWWIREKLTWEKTRFSRPTNHCPSRCPHRMDKPKD
jgi:nitroimidazol reductase NimA-like FMN-containing flavoprotein (pyridoxamine 5'-phosphate oxidase superfamily)